MNNIIKYSAFILLSTLLFTSCGTDDYFLIENNLDEIVDTTIDNSDYTVGLLYKSAGIADGYVLFTPTRGKNTYLINSNGEIVQQWTSENKVFYAELLPNGRLLRALMMTPVNNEFAAGTGRLGRIEMISPNGNIEWSFEINTQDEFMHHDFEYIESTGNILVETWKYYTKEEAIQAGKTNATTALWSSKIVEISPTTNSIVWEWDAWNHLVQNTNISGENYGIIADNPQLIDINYNTSNGDFLHINSIDYNENLDQIVFSSRDLSEFYIIDHSTTTQEASTHNGGNSGKGGDILYRWGNPQVYDMGNEDDQKLFLQHDVNWINNEYTNGGMLMIFNNQAGNFYNQNYSSINILNPNETIGNSSYILTNGTYTPNNFEWAYTAENPTDLYASFVSGARRLANGNTFITSGANGTMYEIDENETIVWKYISPVSIDNVFAQYETPNNNVIFKSIKYLVGYSGLSYYELNPQGTIENN